MNQRLFLLHLLNICFRLKIGKVETLIISTTLDSLYELAITAQESLDFNTRLKEVLKKLSVTE